MTQIGKFEIRAKAQNGETFVGMFEAPIGDFKECFAQIGWTFNKEDFIGSDFGIWGFVRSAYNGTQYGRTEVIARGKA